MRFPTWVLGYADAFSVAPGESLALHVSGGGAATVDVQLVKLRHGDTQPEGPGFHESEVPSAADGTYPLTDQNDSYKVAPEEIEFMFDGVGGTEHPHVRADLTYFETPGGGAVFAASSIAWSGSLSHGNYANSVSRITGNVLDRFLGCDHG